MLKDALFRVEAALALMKTTSTKTYRHTQPIEKILFVSSTNNDDPHSSCDMSHVSLASLVFCQKTNSASSLTGARIQRKKERRWWSSSIKKTSRRKWCSAKTAARSLSIIWWARLASRPFVTQGPVLTISRARVVRLHSGFFFFGATR